MLWSGSETPERTPAGYKTMLWSGSETPECQQDSSPCQAKRTPKECFTLPLEPIKNNALVRFRNTRMPAGFEPMPNETHAERMLHVTFGTHKKQCVGPVPKHPNASRIRAHPKQPSISLYVMHYHKLPKNQTKAIKLLGALPL